MISVYVADALFLRVAVSPRVRGRCSGDGLAEPMNLRPSGVSYRFMASGRGSSHGGVDTGVSSGISRVTLIRTVDLHRVSVPSFLSGDVVHTI